MIDFYESIVTIDEYDSDSVWFNRDIIIQFKTMTMMYCQNPL